MRINPNISASAIQRYEKVVHRETAAAKGLSTSDKVELSEQAKLYSSLIKAAKSSESDVSDSKVHAVLNRMASGTYHVDVSKLAAKMMNGGQDDE